MKVYLSHKITGGGKSFSHIDMKKNCDEAIDAGKQIRAALSSIELYIPAESEDFVGIAYQDNYLTIQEILEVDCKIIDTCEIVIVYIPKGDELQGGRLVEYNHAVREKKPIYIFKDVQQVIVYLTKYIMGV